MKHTFFFLLFFSCFFNIHAQQKNSVQQLLDKGVYFIKTKEYTKANEKLKSAVDIIEKIGSSNDTSLADCLSYLAYSYLLLNNKPLALKNYTKAYNIYVQNNSTEHLNFKGVLYNIARINYEIKNYNDAEKYYLNYLDILKMSESDPNEYLEAIIDLISIYYNTSQKQILELYLKKIITIYPKSDSLNYFKYLFQLANTCLENINYNDAENYFKLVIDFNKNNFKDKDYLFNKQFIEGSYANLKFEQGKYTEAEEIFLQNIETIKLIKDNNLIDESGPLYNLALVYQKLRNYEKAKSYCFQAMNVQKKKSSENSKLYAMLKIALASIKKDNHENLIEVIKLINEALLILRNKEGEYGMNYVNAVQNLANVYCLQNEFKKAIPMYLEVINKRKKILGINHPEYAKALSNLGAAYSDMGDIKNSKTYFTETLKIYNSTYNEGAEQLTSIYDNLAIQFEKEKDTLKHLAFELKSMKSLNRGNINNLIALSENEKLKYLQDVNVYFDQFKSTLFKYGQKDSLYLEEAYNNEMQNKSFTLKSSLEIRNRVLKSGDTSLISIYEMLISKKEILSKNYSLPSDLRRVDLSNIESDVEDLEKKMTKKTILYPYINQPLKYTYKDVKKKLKADEVAIEFISFRYYNKTFTDSIIYGALILKPDCIKPKFVYLFEEKKLQSLLSNIDGISTSNFINNLYLQSGNGQKLYNLIWLPLDTLLKQTKTIYVSSSGLLHKIAIGAIPYSDTTTISDSYNVQIIGSTADLINAEIFGTQSDSIKEAFIFGGINYDIAKVSQIETNQQKNSKSSNYIPIDSTRGNSGNWKYLNGTKKEAEDIFTQFSLGNIFATIYYDSSATETLFKNLRIDKKCILHIATHGYFYPDLPSPEKITIKDENKSEFKVSKNPLFRSGLIFAGANSAWSNSSYDLKFPDDGILTSYEVSNLDLRNVNLVVLSACETGLGDIKDSEGVFGLQRSFKLAGVKNIIMSLWKISDEKTRELMQLFYKNILNGKTINVGFNLAQKDMKNKYPNSPYYWSSFILLQ